MTNAELIAKVRWLAQPPCNGVLLDRAFLLNLADALEAADQKLNEPAHDGPLQGHNIPCCKCGTRCDALAADPSRWPLALVPVWHECESGLAEVHCSGCVHDMMATSRENAGLHAHLDEAKRQMAEIDRLAALGAPDLIAQANMRGATEVERALGVRLEIADRMGDVAARKLVAMANGRDAAIAELDALTESNRKLAEECEDVRAEAERLRAALLTIQQWDCLNPPRRELCDDHPWLKRLVDAALAPRTGKEEG